MKILIPFDFSSTSLNAIQYGIDLAKKIKAEIKLLHVFNSEQKENYRLGELYSSLVNQNQEDLDSLNLELIIKNSSKIPELIIDYAQTNSDMIIMGAKGYGNSDDKLLGSVTMKVVYHSSMPVLAIPANVQFTGLQEIALAEDFEKIDRENTSFVADLANKMGATARVVHMYEVKDNSNNNRTSNFESIKRDLKNRLNENVKFDFLNGYDMKRTLSRYVEHQNIDLLGLILRDENDGSFGKNGQSGLVKEVLRNADIPILCMK